MGVDVTGWPTMTREDFPVQVHAVASGLPEWDDEMMANGSMFRPEMIAAPMQQDLEPRAKDAKKKKKRRAQREILSTERAESESSIAICPPKTPEGGAACLPSQSQGAKAQKPPAIQFVDRTERGTTPVNRSPPKKVKKGRVYKTARFDAGKGPLVSLNRSQLFKLATHLNHEVRDDTEKCSPVAAISHSLQSDLGCFIVVNVVHFPATSSQF